MPISTDTSRISISSSLRMEGQALSLKIATCSPPLLICANHSQPPSLMADTAISVTSPYKFHVVSFRTAPPPPYHPYRRPSSELPFCCTLCGTGYTPLRRAGPRGRNTLCNACGLQWARKERVKREPRSVSAPSSPQEQYEASPPSSSANSPRSGSPTNIPVEHIKAPMPAASSGTNKMAIAALLN